MKKAENWEFSSLTARLQKNKKPKVPLSTLPINEPKNYLAFVNTPITASELEAIRSSVGKGKIFGNDSWKERITRKYGIPVRREKAGRPRGVKNGT